MMASTGDDGEQEERETDVTTTEINSNNNNNNNEKAMAAAMSRKEKRKAMKKMKRKQVRREMAVKKREEEEARLNDPEEQMRQLRLEQEEAERMERDRLEFEERERMFLQALELKKKMQEEKLKLLEESRLNSVDNENAKELNEDDDWEYVEEGPAEIIWKGNEIIVKKKKVRVPKKGPGLQNGKQESDRPISNPLAPQSEAFQDYKSAKEVLESVAQQVPNFGTEQDKAHCPFHLKTGACRFGARCSRVHFYPDKSCTLLMKNMYNGAGLALEQDEGLEYTDEEVERAFEEFYEDVHTELLKFGEIVNFKVCKNASSHLRGNVYVHYKLLDSAVLAYQSINGRYFAGKQITCEFVNVTRWKVAICGEFMKSRLKTCSRGSACNFIHCFRNPGGDYEWADWDKPAPRYWLEKMAALFGYTDDDLIDEVSPRYHSRRSRSRGPDSTHGKSRSEEGDNRRRRHLSRHRGDSREGASNLENISSQEVYRIKHRKSDLVEKSDGSSDDKRSSVHSKRSSRKRERDPEEFRRRDSTSSNVHEAPSDRNGSSKKGENHRCRDDESRSSSRQKRGRAESIHDHHNHSDDYNEFDRRENPHVDRHRDKYHRHKGKHTSPRKKEADSSDIDSHGDTLVMDEDRHHRHSKKSSRQMKNEAELSDNSSDGNRLGGDEKTGAHRKRREKSRSKNKSDSVDIKSDRKRHEKEERHHRHSKKSSRQMRNDAESSDSASDGDRHGGHHEKRDQRKRKERSRSKNKSDSVDIKSDIERHEEEERHHRHEKRSSRHHSKVSELSKVDSGTHRHTSCQDVKEESETEREQAYRLAALKKLEEMKCKDSQPVRSKEHQNIESHSYGSAVAKGAEVSKDQEEMLGSSKVETSAASTKRRRI